MNAPQAHFMIAGRRKPASGVIAAPQITLLPRVGYNPFIPHKDEKMMAIHKAKGESILYGHFLLILSP